MKEEKEKLESKEKTAAPGAGSPEKVATVNAPSAIPQVSAATPLKSLPANSLETPAKTQLDLQNTPDPSALQTPAKGLEGLEKVDGILKKLIDDTPTPATNKFVFILNIFYMLTS